MKTKFEVHSNRRNGGGAKVFSRPTGSKEAELKKLVHWIADSTELEKTKELKLLEIFILVKLRLLYSSPGQVVNKAVGFSSRRLIYQLN